MFTVWVMMIILTDAAGSYQFEYATRDECVKNATFVDKQAGVYNTFCFPVTPPQVPVKK